MKKVIFATLGALVPTLALAAQGQANFSQLGSIFLSVQSILNIVIPIVITLGVIYFIWNVIQYVTNKNEEERAGAKSGMIYGIIGLFVIVSIWGLVGFVGNLVGVDQGGSALIPCVTDADNNPYNGCQ